MPTPSKFTAANRKALLDAIKLGAPRKTAAAHARIGEATFRRWMEDGKAAREGSAKRKFHDDVLQAETQAPLRALALVYDGMEDNLGIAFKFLERRMPGFAPPMPHLVSGPPTPVLIQLSFHDGGPIAASEVEAFIEGEVVEQDETAGPRGLPAPRSSA